MKEKINIPSFLLEHIPWENHVDPIWTASTFVLHRNLAKFCFPSKLSKPHMLQVASMLQESLLKSPLLKTPSFLPAEKLSPMDKEYLFEHFFSQSHFQNTMEGQGFIIDQTSYFLGMINVDDHIQLHLVDAQGKWDNSWNTLSQLDTTLGKSLDYAFSSRFGYLTSNPGLCGTGLEVYVYLHLPALIHTGKLSETLSKETDEEVLITGMQGTLEELVGDFIVLKNRYSLGLSEETILKTLYAAAMKLMAAEKTARTQIQQEDNSEIKDQISRAYGLLMHSFQLQTKEALAALSLIKLGINLGWVEGITDNKLNEIFFKCQRAHLAHAHTLPEIDPKALPHTRAAFIHTALKPTHLTY
ncbi:MAG: protein arginine kinase [Chlamydiota bacterium]